MVSEDVTFNHFHMASQCSCSVMPLFFNMRNLPISWYVFSIYVVNRRRKEEHDRYNSSVSQWQPFRFRGPMQLVECATPTASRSSVISASMKATRAFSPILLFLGSNPSDIIQINKEIMNGYERNSLEGSRVKAAGKRLWLSWKSAGLIIPRS